MIKTKFLSVVLTLCMILSIFSISAMAETTLNLSEFDYSNIKITVSADTGNTDIPNAIIYVYRSDASALSDANPPVYMDFVTLTNGAFENKEILFPLDLEPDDYKLDVYYNGGSLSESFKYYSAEELLNARKNEILAEVILVASSDAQIIENVLFNADSAGGTKVPANDVIVNSAISGFSDFADVANKAEVFNRMKEKNLASVDSFDKLIALFKECSTAQKNSENRETPITPSDPSKDNTKPGNNKGSISVSGGSVGGSVGGSAGTTTGAAPAFSDMKGHWGEKYAKLLSNKKIINGYEDGSFKPENNVTRAEIAKMLVTGFNIGGANAISFADVSAGSWYAGFVARASAAGIVTGYEGKFNPDGNLTRQDAALMVFRVLEKINELPKTSASFKDDTKISDYASNAVKVLGAIKVLTGDTDGNFNPLAPITRAEIAAVICRALDWAQLN